MLVAGLELTTSQYDETEAICAAFRDGHRSCIAWDLTSIIATVALSGLSTVLIVGSESARREVVQLGSTLSFAGTEAQSLGSRPLYGPVVSFGDYHALYTGSPKHDMVVVLVTVADLCRKVYTSRKSPSGLHILVHAPVMLEEDYEALKLSVESLAGVGGAWTAPSPRWLPPVQFRFERRQTTLPETMASSVRKALQPGADEADLMIAFSRARMCLRRDADVVAEVRSEMVPDRSVVVVCENKTACENMRRSLAKSGLSAALVVQLDTLTSRIRCMDGAKGARTPLIVFADPPLFEVELRAACASASEQMGRTPNCVVFAWGKPGAFEPRRWSPKLSRAEVEASLASLFD